MRRILITLALLGTTACVQPQWPMDTGGPLVAPARDSAANAKGAPGDTSPPPLRHSRARAP